MTTAMARAVQAHYFTRHADVLTALQDDQRIISRPWQTAMTIFGEQLRQQPQSAGSGGHQRFARVLRPLWSPKVIAAYEPQLRAQAARLVASIARRGECDAVTAITETHPYRALTTVLGLPPGAACLEAARNIPNDPEKFIRELLALADHAILANGRKNPPGIIFELFDGLEQPGFPLSHAEVLGVLLSIFAAGLDTVASTIHFGLLRLAQNPDLHAVLRERPNEIPKFIDEVLRLDCPVAFTPRQPVDDITLGGIKLPAGTEFWLGLQAAGHQNGGDQICRTPDGGVRRQRHFGLGAGVHRCLGAALARLELRLFFEEWLTRIPSFATGESFVPEIKYGPTLTLQSLPLRWPTKGTQ